MITLLFVILALILLWQNIVMTFKIGLYEQALTSNKQKFGKELSEMIGEAMKIKSPFQIFKFTDKVRNNRLKDEELPTPMSCPNCGSHQIESTHNDKQHDCNVCGESWTTK